MDSLLTNLINLGGCGVIALVMGWKVIPALLATFGEQMAAERAQCRADIRELREDLKVHRAELLQAVAKPRPFDRRSYEEDR